MLLATSVISVIILFALAIFSSAGTMNVLYGMYSFHVSSFYVRESYGQERNEYTAIQTERSWCLCLVSWNTQTEFAFQRTTIASKTEI